jgi:hypothetical protein
MSRRQALAALFLLLALAGCAPLGAAPGQAPAAPYSRDDNGGMRGGGDGGNM